ncbi:MAG: ATP-binding cassette domain-containing protein [Anaerolineales bacterium]
MTTKSKTHSLIWQLVTYQPWLSVAYTGLFVIIYIMELAPRLITKLFFDTLTGHQPLGFNLTSVIVLVLATRGFHILTIGAGAVIGARQRFAVGGLLRRNLLAHILHRPGAQAVSAPGEALNTIRDDVDEVVGVMAWLADQIAIFTYTAIAMAIMLRIDARITLLALLPLVVVILVSRATSARAERYRKATREATARVNGALTEILGAVQAIKVACAEPHATAHLDKLGQRRQHAIVRDRALNQLIISLCEEAGTLTAGMVLMLGASRIRNQTLTVGDFALLITSLDSITMFIVESGGFTAYFKQVGVALQRILALVRSEPTALSEAEAADLLVAHHPLYLREEPPAVPFPAREPGDRLARLSVSGLTYHYPSAHGSDANGIEDITFSLDRGDFIVITGRIAAGKTTLLRALLGLLPAERGVITWNGAPVAAPADFFVPPRSAYTAQIPHLFSETLRDNILMGLPEERVDLLGAIQRAALTPDVARMPDGLETRIGPRGVRLSGGQRQRTAAARMFVRDPELLVFDDLSSALDVETERALWEGVFARGRDRAATCLVVSHRRPALQRADHILLLDAGRLAAQGTLEALLTSSAEMRRIWGEG